MYTFTRLTAAALGILLGNTTLQAQPRYDFTRLKAEHLDRGVVAVRQDDGRVFVSWRTLKSDRVGQPFDIYRDGQQLNTAPLTTGGTCIVDDLPAGSGAEYEVRGGGINGRFTLKADAPAHYLAIPLDNPEGGTTPEGRSYFYSANDASVGDVDGDG